MAKSKVFLDANVLFAMANSPAGFASRLLLADNLSLISSDYAFQEAAENLAAFNSEALAELGKLEANVIITDRIAPLPFWVSLDGEDRQILAAAIGAECDYLISYDRDFDSLFDKTISNVEVIHATKFIRRFKV